MAVWSPVSAKEHQAEAVATLVGEVPGLVGLINENGGKRHGATIAVVGRVPVRRVRKGRGGGGSES